MSQSYKQCVTCNRVKHTNAFYISRGNVCKSCEIVSALHRQSEKTIHKLRTTVNPKTVYILEHPIFDGFYRLGSTSNLPKRLNAHRSGIPRPSQLRVIFQHASDYGAYLELILSDILETHPDCLEREDSFFKIDKDIMLSFSKEVVEHEEASLRHRDQQPSQSHLVLCN